MGEQTLETERQRLAEADLLTPGLIHEVRTPLTAIKAGMLLVARELGDEVTRLDPWQMIAAQVQRLEELFASWQELLDHRRAEPAEPFDLVPVVRRAADLLRFRLKRLGAGFSVVEEVPAAAVHGQPNALLHAVTNLLVNAVDAVGDGAGRVEVRVLPAGRTVQVRVADDGPGIPPELRPRIFEPRFTTKPNGTGLGLAIARGVIEASGGAVWLVPDDDPDRRAWARTEFAVGLSGAGVGAR
jgi:signal transduction histidine kinase